MSLLVEMLFKRMVENVSSVSSYIYIYCFFFCRDVWQICLVGISLQTFFGKECLFRDFLVETSSSGNFG